MGQVPATPAEMQAFIIERLQSKQDDVSDFDVLCDIVAKKLATNLAEQIPLDIADTIIVKMLDRITEPPGGLKTKVHDDGSLISFAAEESKPWGYASIDANAAAVLFGASMGADESIQLPRLTSPLSPIERGVLEICAHPLASAMEHALPSGSGSFQTRVWDQSSIDQADFVASDVVSFRFSLSFGETEGQIALHIPQNLMAMSEEPVFAENDNITEWHDSLRDGIMQMNVGVNAIVKLDATTLGDLNQLDVGDVIELPMENPHMAFLTARDKTLFIGKFGRVGNRYSVRVDRPDQRREDLVEHIMSTM